jgi:phosphoadenosine phosphosulfate reductase
VNRALSSMTVEARLTFARETFGSDLVLLSSMQRTASVLMHLFFTLGFDNEILFGDTGYHFHETLKLRDIYMREFKLNIVTLYPEMTPEEQEAQHGKKLYTCADGQPECCRLRKETPLIHYLKRKRCPVVVNGLRRSEGGRRADIRPLNPDPRTGGYALSPIFDWTASDIERYIETHKPPIHPLHDKQYPSIGCSPCTTPVKPWEDARAGRWRHLRTEESDEHTYCGINFTDGAGI